MKKILIRKRTETSQRKLHTKLMWVLLPILVIAYLIADPPKLLEAMQYALMTIALVSFCFRDVENILSE